MGSKRRMVPVFGGLAATATVGAVPLAHAAVAAPAPDTGTDDGGELGLAQDGTFESCSAYFGFGKDEGEAPNATGFTVTDVSGDADGATHVVPDDVQVVLVLENDEGDTVECTPEAITEEEWNDVIAEEWEWFPGAPAFPEHPVYAYPTFTDPPEDDLDQTQFIEGVGEVVAVGFRVVGVPDGHTLVAPSGVQPLPDHFAGVNGDIFVTEADPRVVALLEAEVGPAAATAFAAAIANCDDEELDDPTDADLLAATNFLADFSGFDVEFVENDCFDLYALHGEAQRNLAILGSASHVEAITLAAPTAPAQPVPPAPTPPAAQPVPAAPSFTG